MFYSRRVGGNIFFNNYNYETKIDYAFKYTGQSANQFLYGILLSESSINTTSNIISNSNISIAAAITLSEALKQNMAF